MSDILWSPAQMRRRRGRFALAALILALVAVGLGWWWESDSSTSKADDSQQVLAAAGMDDKQRAAVEAVVREYILEHPEILPEAMQRLQDRGVSQQIAQVRDQVEQPFPGAVLGNPNGKVTLVEFMDFACGYCRQSVPDIEALIQEHPDLRVVVRELPILSPQSETAAKMALAAARQGRYPEFHHAMFSGEKPSEQSIAVAAQKAGLNLTSAKQVANSPEIAAELKRNLDLASRLGIQGTPTFVVGDRMMSGAVGREQLGKAIEEARNAA